MATASSGSCVVDAKLEVSYDSLSGSPTTWVKVPATIKHDKAYNETQANKLRHSDSGQKFVTSCGTTTRSEVYTISALFCNDDPITWYLRDGDEFWWRLTKGTTSPASSFTEQFKGKYVDGGFSWDNNTEDGEQITFTIEATGTVTHGQPAGTGKHYSSTSW